MMQSLRADAAGIFLLSQMTWKREHTNAKLSGNKIGRVIVQRGKLRFK